MKNIALASKFDKFVAKNALSKKQVKKLLYLLKLAQSEGFIKGCESMTRIYMETENKTKVDPADPLPFKQTTTTTYKI